MSILSNRPEARRGRPLVEYRLYFKTGGKIVTEDFDVIRHQFKDGDTLVVDRVGEFDANLTDAAYAQLGVNLWPTKKGPNATRFNQF